MKKSKLIKPKNRVHRPGPVAILGKGGRHQDKNKPSRQQIRLELKTARDSGLSFADQRDCLILMAARTGDALRVSAI